MHRLEIQRYVMMHHDVCTRPGEGGGGGGGGGSVTKLKRQCAAQHACWADCSTGAVRRGVAEEVVAHLNGEDVCSRERLIGNEIAPAFQLDVELLHSFV